MSVGDITEFLKDGRRIRLTDALPSNGDDVEYARAQQGLGQEHGARLAVLGALASKEFAWFEPAVDKADANDQPSSSEADTPGSLRLRRQRRQLGTVAS